MFGIVCALVGAPVNAQVSAYIFSQGSAAYTAVGSPTTVHASGWDDAVSAAAPIPFTFNYNGVGYTSCRISSNGFLTFGATAPTTTNYTPISSTAGYIPAAPTLFDRGRLINQSICP